jgi:hypothetical protein
MLWLEELLSRGESKYYWRLPTFFSTHPTCDERKTMIFETLQAYHLLYQPKDFNEYDDSIQSTTIRTIKHVVIMIISIVLFFCIVNDILFL